MADIGSVLGGRYRLIELLGQGGMATIYRAHDVQLDRDVAVKLLRAEYGRDPDFLARFRQEAQNVAQLNHPNVVDVYDYGQDANGPFIVMELVDGEDLASILRRTGPLPPRQAARIAAEVAEALAAAHARGIVHRDVKPGNILISSDGRVMVTDFGIARAIAEAQVTLPGTTLGSVHYFSPEQARGEPASEASDIYALGIVLYEMLAGRRPWEGDTAAAIAVARLSGPAPMPSSVRQGIPPALEAIDRKALAPAAAERFPSAAAMAGTLETFLAARATPGAVVNPAGPAPGGGQPAADAAGAPNRPRVSPQRVANPDVPYPDDAYAGAEDVDARSQARPGSRPRSGAYNAYRDEGPGGTGPWVWVAGLFALLILVAVGFFAFQLLNRSGGPTSSPPVEQVTVPDFIGLPYDQAKVQADRLGIQLLQSAFLSGNQPPNTILEQDPKPGTRVDKGAAVRLTLTAAAVTVAVPDLRGLKEPAAIQAILAASLTVGDRTDAFDPVVPIGSVVSQDPRAGLQVSRQTPVNYVVSKGPEPSTSPTPSASPTPSETPAPTATPTATPTPSPSPTPLPTPAPTPAPTPTPEPTPTPLPTPSPTPAPVAVGEYRCVELRDALALITADGFTVGEVGTNPTGQAFDDLWVVRAQLPTPGEQRPVGTSIRLTVQDPLLPCP